MSSTFTKILFAFIFILGGILCADAQMPDASSNNRNPQANRPEDLPDAIKETLAKKRIAAEEKEFAELLGRGEEAVKLSEELNKSFETNRKLSSDDIKKLARLEKLVKKIRDEIGGVEDTDDKNNLKNKNSLSLQESLKDIQKDASNLLTEIKKTGPYGISVGAIENSNSLLNLVRTMRFIKN